MASEELQRLWQSIRSDLGKARSLLPLQEAEGEKGLRRYEEWLEHNELELAFDELETLGEGSRCPMEFWLSLHRAAEKMRLTEHAERISRRLSEFTGGSA